MPQSFFIIANKRRDVRGFFPGKTEKFSNDQFGTKTHSIEQ